MSAEHVDEAEPVVVRVNRVKQEFQPQDLSFRSGVDAMVEDDHYTFTDNEMTNVDGMNYLAQMYSPTTM